jgi:hypothetical protein
LWGWPTPFPGGILAVQLFPTSASRSSPVSENCCEFMQVMLFVTKQDQQNRN